ncbi:hypothetical protein Sme01_19280 [Sphaerisporangium melleum]|uniref:DUF1963 domain-containing protein n=1 Tax=Sphaerisporangium melleum TaxID=321316 RepID=A0A917VNI6_9ACTN|nr:YwqG family protein [Sphaerisporangium melleum]GGL02991.1 hypothetical protein GCM10007964_51360 [Sphaerisporangium melleum]GII69452.1 hypothetical protein Sme01_19280 [Sphaerisporangium melleum]
MHDWMLDFAEYVRELLPEELAEPFIALARPAIRLSTAEVGQTIVGRLGGLPRLPEGMPWPRTGNSPMEFLAELDCAALAAYESDIDLPPEGALLFFAAWDSTAARVILLPTGTRRVPEREVPVGEETRLYPETRLAAETVATWPTRGHDVLVKLGDDFWDRLVGEEPWEVFGDLLSDFEDAEGGRAHQVGGYSDALHTPIEATAAYAAGPAPEDPGFATEASQWVNLLQLDEDNGMIFGDGGILIGIRRDRLAARDFSQVLPDVQGH